MRYPPTPAEQELWNAVVAGVRAAGRMDRMGFEAAVERLVRLPSGWAHRALRDTTVLLVEEVVPDAGALWPVLTAPVDRAEVWLPEMDRGLLATLLPGHVRPPGTDVPGEPEHTRHRLLLIACLADAAEVGVGAFIDVALADDSSRAVRSRSRSVPQSRVGR